MSYHIICDDFYEHFVHRHFPYITRSNRSGFGVTSIVFLFYFGTSLHIVHNTLQIIIHQFHRLTLTANEHEPRKSGFYF